MIAKTEAQMATSTYDVRFAALTGLPDVTMTKGTLINTVTPVRQLPEQWTVITARQRGDGEKEPARDTVFVTYVGPDGTMRIALPYQVADAIVRQRDALTSQSRKRAAKAEAARRKAAGIQPAFLNGEKKGKKAKKPADGG